jgi:hypothetical protein
MKLMIFMQSNAESIVPLNLIKKTANLNHGGIPFYWQLLFTVF